MLSRESVIFGDFLEFLKKQGFTIGVDHYIRLHTLVGRITNECPPQELKTLICPLFATSADQQRLFYDSFDRFFPSFCDFAVERQKPGESKPNVSKVNKVARSHAWPFRLAGLVLGTAIGLVVILVVVFTILKSQPLPLTNQLPKLDYSPGPLNFQLFLWGFAIIGLLLLLLYEIRQFGRRRSIDYRLREKKPPFQWPLQIPERNETLYRDSQFYIAVRGLRHRKPGDFTTLNVVETIKATINAWGHYTPRYKTVTAIPEYLILIDRRSFRDHQAQLFNLLVKSLDIEGAYVTAYWYDQDPRLCYAHSTGGASYLADLESRYAGHRLIIFGDGYSLIDHLTGGLASWSNLFLTWDERILLTPKATADWEFPEHVLSELFRILPATIDGLVDLAGYFESNEPFTSQSSSDRELTPSPTEKPTEEIIEHLRKYLGEDLFRWLCACAVYPELQWELTLHIARILKIDSFAISHGSILKLARLPWFRTGSIPGDYRWRLVNCLDPSTLATVRSAIIDLLKTNSPPDNTFAAEVRQLNLAFQEWLAQPSRETRRRLRNVIQTMPGSELARDSTILEYLKSSRLSLGTMIPEWLGNLLYQRGAAVFGLTKTARVFALFGCLLLLMGSFSVNPTNPPSGDAVTRPAPFDPSSSSADTKVPGFKLESPQPPAGDTTKPTQLKQRGLQREEPNGLGVPPKGQVASKIGSRKERPVAEKTKIDQKPPNEPTNLPGTPQGNAPPQGQGPPAPPSDLKLTPQGNTPPQSQASPEAPSNSQVTPQSNTPPQSQGPPETRGNLQLAPQSNAPPPSQRPPAAPSNLQLK